MPYTVDLRGVQAPLKEKYRSDPASALVVTAAHSVDSDLSDPRHCAVAPTEYPAVTISSGLPPAAGGAGDTPCSGDILAAALAMPATRLFLYGKRGPRAGRKMGHLGAIGATTGEALERALDAAARL